MTYENTVNRGSNRRGVSRLDLYTRVSTDYGFFVKPKVDENRPLTPYDAAITKLLRFAQYDPSVRFTSAELDTILSEPILTKVTQNLMHELTRLVEQPCHQAGYN